MNEACRIELDTIQKCLQLAQNAQPTRFIWLAKQVALGEAYARSGVLCGIFRSVCAERSDHEHVLAVFAGTAASLSCA